MMGEPDDFDAQLRAAFQSEEAAIPDDGFSERVIARLGHGNRNRYLMLGGAGSIGAAFAGVQVERVFDALPTAAGMLGEIQTVVGSETLAAAAMMIVVGIVTLAAAPLGVRVSV